MGVWFELQTGGGSVTVLGLNLPLVYSLLATCDSSDLDFQGWRETLGYPHNLQYNKGTVQDIHTIYNIIKGLYRISTQSTI